MNRPVEFARENITNEDFSTESSPLHESVFKAQHRLPSDYNFAARKGSLLSILDEVPNSIKEELVKIFRHAAEINTTLDWPALCRLINSAQNFVQEIHTRSREGKDLQLSHVQSTACAALDDAAKVQEMFTNAKIRLDSLTDEKFGVRQKSELRRKMIRRRLSTSRLISAIGNSISTIGLCALVVVVPGTTPLALPLCVISAINSAASCTVREVDRAQAHADTILNDVRRKLAVLAETYRNIKRFVRLLRDQLAICDRDEALIPSALCINDMLIDLDESLEFLQKMIT